MKRMESHLGQSGAWIVLASLVVLAGCGGPQASVMPGQAAGLAPSNASRQTSRRPLGGAFFARYSGHWRGRNGRCGFPCQSKVFHGTGTATILGTGRERMTLHIMVSQGPATLTSSTSKRDTINMIVQGSACTFLTYAVVGGTGRFTRAAGSGTVVSNCNGQDYTDVWAGSLYY